MSNTYKNLMSLIAVFLLVFVYCALGDETKDGEDDGVDTVRELREYDHESWHAIRNIPEGASDWIPRDPTEGQAGVVYTKRRRLRKRKRRPPVVTVTNDDIEDSSKEKFKLGKGTDNIETDLLVRAENRDTTIHDQIGQEDLTQPKRRKRPNINDPWQEMQEESNRPYIRRKVTPPYQTSEQIGITTGPNENLNPDETTVQFGTFQSQDPEASHVYHDTPKKTQHHSTARKHKPTTPRSRTNKPPNLRAILKQNGGLSLSEILQKKNLTLSELLTGNDAALKALTESSDRVSTVMPLSENKNKSENQIFASTSSRKEYFFVNSISSSTEKSPSYSSWHSSDLEDLISSSTQKSADLLDNLEVTKYKRLPPSVALKKENINRKFEQYEESQETLSEKEMLEAQRKRLALLQGHGYKNMQSSKFSDVTRFEVITEPTTEKRIFVPSHPKLYTSIDYRPEFSKLTESNTEAYKTKSKESMTTTQKDDTQSTNIIQSISTTEKTFKTTTEYPQSTKSTKTSFTKSKIGLPITSAKLNKMLSKRPTSTETPVAINEDNYPEVTPWLFKPLKIDVKDVLGLLNSENQSEEKVTDGPLRMSIDLDTVTDKSTSLPPPYQQTATTQLPSSTPSSTGDTPKLKPFSARDEILEIFKDPKGRSKLAEILEARNMTIQELIDQRERGSSQLHLADIFHNKTKEPEPLDEPLEGRISSEVFTSFPVFMRQPKKLKQDDSTQKPVETSSQIDSVLVTAFPSFKIEVQKNKTRDYDSNPQTFPWVQLYPDLFNLQDKNQEKPIILPIIREMTNNRIEQATSTNGSVDILTEEDVHRLEDMDQRLFSSVASEQLNIVDEVNHKVIKIPSGVQSAIVASLVIVGMSLLVFVTILVGFRWTQKRKTKLKYCDSLKPPLFNVKSQYIKTFMAETLGKTKFNYYKNNLQRMNDVWERDSSRKSSF